MSITYPLSVPTSGNYVNCRMAPMAVVTASYSPYTLHQQVQEFPGQAWSGEVGLAPMKRATAEQWIAFRLKLNGIRGTFLFGDPNSATPRGTNPVQPTVAGGSQTGNVLRVNGYAPFATGVLLAGDYIQLSSGASARLHKILDDVDASSDGSAEVLIWPSLRESPANGGIVVTSSAKGVFRMVQNDMSWEVSGLRLYGVGFAFMEAL